MTNNSTYTEAASTQACNCHPLRRCDTQQRLFVLTNGLTYVQSISSVQGTDLLATLVTKIHLVVMQTVKRRHHDGLGRRHPVLLPAAAAAAAHSGM